MYNKNLNSIKGRHKTLMGVLCLFAIFLFASSGSAQSNSNSGHTPAQKKKIYLIHANTLSFDKEKSADYQILRGNVKFRQDSAYMYCDSAYFYEKNNSMDAFGHVKMEQGDTLFIFGDKLFYNGDAGMARLRDNVRMINKDVTLLTDSLNYDRRRNIGYFFDGGTVIDPDNELSSVYGQYSPDTKIAVFQDNVELKNSKFTLYSDTLIYNTSTGIATIVGESRIVSDSNVIYTDRGWYDTRRDLAMLLDYSKIVGTNQTLTGDTIYYDRKTGFGEVFGGMKLNDSTRKLILTGDYGFYNEITEYAFATKRAMAVEYSQGDSLFLHADTLRSNVVDSARMMQAYHGVRFYKTSAQGVCDSLRYSTADSTIIMYQNPVLWNETYQIYGDTIFILMNDSSIEKTTVKDFAMLAQDKGNDHYDQIAGKVMHAYFKEGDIDRMDMSGNVQVIFYPEESDKSLIGLNKAESSFLKTTFLKRQLNRLVMWPEVNGTLTPMLLVKPDMLYLPSFRWYSDLRPVSKADIFRKVKMKEEDIIRPTKIFTQEELEGNQGLDLPETEYKVRSVVEKKLPGKTTQQETDALKQLNEFKSGAAEELKEVEQEFSLPEIPTVPVDSIIDTTMVKRLMIE